jgi:hypothetical protein
MRHGVAERGTMREPMPSEYVGMRIPKELLERIDAYLERMNRDHPGLTFSRADAIKTLVAQALDNIEGKPKKSAGK